MSGVILTNENFDAEVVKSDTPVLVDFWAEWCVAPETEVVLSHYQVKSAKDISVGEKLIGYQKGMTAGQVIHSKTVTDAGHCKEITTLSGRKIRVTDDHLVFTQRGWIKAAEVLPQDKVAVLPYTQSVKGKASSRLLLMEDDIFRVATPRMRINQYLTKLKKLGLLPLHEDHPGLPTIARLMGALFSDGCLYQQEKNNYREISFTLGIQADADAVTHDLSALGFSAHVKERLTKRTINGRTFTSKGVRVKCLSSTLWLLFVALGVPVGKKTDAAFTVPTWLMHAAKPVQQAFLSGFLGGDGPKLSILLQARAKKEPYNHLVINDLELYKRVDLAESGLQFAQQIATLLRKFDAKVARVFNENVHHPRHDGTESTSIHIRFAHDFSTGRALAQNIGYAYCQQKQEAAHYVGEFLRERLYERTLWQKLYRQVLRLGKQGLGYRRVSRQLGLRPLLAFNWLKGRTKATTAHRKVKFPTWLSEVTKGLTDGFLWQSISAVRTVYLPAVQRVSVSPTHNFVANGILVHNCGPCKISEPTVEEIAKQYEGKVKVGKVNVDDNQELAAKYGVMSIPTFIVFKKDKEMSRFIGAQPKEKFEEEINKVL